MKIQGKVLFTLALSILFSNISQVQAQTQSKYFVIQNVATDRTRVYERCGRGPGCSHRLVLETKTLYGMPTDTDTPQNRYRLRTWLGTFKIAQWRKFYADQAKKHSPWWGPDFPTLPRKGASLLEWIKVKYQAPGYSREGTRGAFGWYAAILNPSPDGQWMHGTYGWGSDGDKFMDKFVEEGGGGYLNFSSGCTRVENQAAAWMQHHLPVGTEIYRIYAIEDIADPRLTYYENQKKPAAWDWVLTKEIGLPALSSDKNSVQARGLSKDMVLEQGRFLLDQYPNRVAIRGGNAGRSIRDRARQDQGEGNNYKIPRSQFRGVYLVDEGRLQNYDHPESLTVHNSNKIPADLIQ